MGSPRSRLALHRSDPNHPLQRLNNTLGTAPIFADTRRRCATPARSPPCFRGRPQRRRPAAGLTPLHASHYPQFVLPASVPHTRSRIHPFAASSCFDATPPTAAPPHELTPFPKQTLPWLLLPVCSAVHPLFSPPALDVHLPFHSPSTPHTHACSRFLAHCPLPLTAERLPPPAPAVFDSHLYATLCHIWAPVALAVFPSTLHLPRPGSPPSPLLARRRSQSCAHITY